MRTHKVRLILFLIMALVCPFRAMASPFVLKNYPVQYLAEVTSGKERHVFEVAVARTGVEAERGLMFVSSLPSDQGMLFLWEQETQVRMWMKNTLIPLDMLFVDNGNVIFQIAANTEPFSENLIIARKPAMAVLEIAGGISAKLDIREGDRIAWHPIAVK